MPDRIHLATICLNSTDDKKANITKAFELISQAADRGASWILLPELFPFMGPYDRLFDNALEPASELASRLAMTAKHLKVVVFAGSVPELPEPELRESRQVYNTQFVFGRDGSLLGKYRKIHLFNLHDEQGKKLYCESDGFISGRDVVTLEIDGFHVGLCTCYDLRFSALFAAMGKHKPLDVIVAPSAFTMQTGMDHWELLLRFRAVESQAYVYAANQTGTHYQGKQSYGHSMIIDPWGCKLCDTGANEGVATAVLDRALINSARARLPALSNRRSDLFPQV